MTSFVGLCYNPDFKKLKADWDKDIRDDKSKLSYMEQYLGNSTKLNKNNKNKPKKYLLNDNRLGFVDFKFFSYLDFINVYDSSILKTYPNILGYYKRICAMDFIKKFESKGLRTLNIWSAAAQWQGTSDDAKDDTKNDDIVSRPGGPSKGTIDGDDILANALKLVKDDIIAKGKAKNIDVKEYKAVSVLKQVVAGITYYVKIKIDADKYCFAKIWAKLDKTAELNAVIFGKKADDKIAIF